MLDTTSKERILCHITVSHDYHMITSWVSDEMAKADGLILNPYVFCGVGPSSCDVSLLRDAGVNDS